MHGNILEKMLYRLGTICTLGKQTVKPSDYMITSLIIVVGLIYFIKPVHCFVICRVSLANFDVEIHSY